MVLYQEGGDYGIDIKKSIWYNLEVLEHNSVIFECKEESFAPYKQEGFLW